MIWVDADACPTAVRDVLFRAAERTHTPLTLVANQYLRTPPLALIKAIQVPQGFDKADDYIVEQTQGWGFGDHSGYSAGRRRN